MGYQSYTKGKLAEDSAVDYLKEQGFQIIERNYHAAFGEIDIIAQESKILVFVEVRLRQESDQVHPLESITRGKQSRLIKTAQMYLAKLNSDCLQCRFDVVAVTQENGQQRFQLYRNMIEGV